MEKAREGAAGEDSRVVVVSIIVRDEEAAAAVNELLHEYRHYIVGRMGSPTGRGRCPSSAWSWTRPGLSRAPCQASWA